MNPVVISNISIRCDSVVLGFVSGADREREHPVKFSLSGRNGASILCDGTKNSDGCRVLKYNIKSRPNLAIRRVRRTKAGEEFASRISRLYVISNAVRSIQISCSQAAESPELSVNVWLGQYPIDSLFFRASPASTIPPDILLLHPTQSRWLKLKNRPRIFGVREVEENPVMIFW